MRSKEEQERAYQLLRAQRQAERGRALAHARLVQARVTAARQAAQQAAQQEEQEEQ